MEVQKSQLLRLWDVFGLGPALVWISMNRRLSRPVRAFLFAEGVLIVLYNGVNYIENRKLEKQGKLTPLNFRQELRET